MSEKPENKDRLGLLPTAVNIALIAGFAALFNIYPEWVGVWRSAAEPASFTPLLGPGYRIYLPALNLWWGLAFSLEAIHVFTRRRTPVTRWVRAALNVYLVILLAWMALGASNFFIPAAMLWLRPLLGLLGLVILLKAYWQIRFVFPKTSMG